MTALTAYVPQSENYTDKISQTLCECSERLNDPMHALEKHIAAR